MTKKKKQERDVNVDISRALDAMVDDLTSLFVSVALDDDRELFKPTLEGIGNLAEIYRQKARESVLEAIKRRSQGNE